MLHRGNTCQASTSINHMLTQWQHTVSLKQCVMLNSNKQWRIRGGGALGAFSTPLATTSLQHTVDHIRAINMQNHRAPQYYSTVSSIN